MQNVTLSHENFGILLKETIGQGLSITILVTGNSMRPLFGHQKTRVLLVPPRNVSRFDIVLFINKEDKYVLHRVIGINDETQQCLLRGDNNLTLDEPISVSQIVAKVQGFFYHSKYFPFHSFRQQILHTWSRLVFFPKKMIYFIRKTFMK